MKRRKNFSIGEETSYWEKTYTYLLLFWFEGRYSFQKPDTDRPFSIFGPGMKSDPLSNNCGKISLSMRPRVLVAYI